MCASIDVGTCQDVQKPASPRPRRSASKRRNFLAESRQLPPRSSAPDPPHSAQSTLPRAAEPIMKLLFLPTLALAASRSFVDDAGVTHTTDKAAPTVIGDVGDLLSLEPVRKSSL